MTLAQREAVTRINGDLFGAPGGITSRSKLSQIAKGFAGEDKVETNKPAFIRDLVASWPTESTLIWCLYNREQDALAKMLPEAASMSGDTPHSERVKIIEDFQSGRLKTLVSKSKILGFGLNLQIATRQVFSGLQDSYELFHQSVKRSNRIGSTRPLNVHIPVCDVERPMIETVLRKANRVQMDTDEQEAIYRKHGIINLLLGREVS
jgi:superfamily II DNA/RNA helicase